MGRNSAVPNVRGIRSDVVAALRAIKVPVVRWPGGCFADEYHWHAGVGPAAKRVTTVNTNWANAVEPNTFGTDEFMDFAAQVGAEAYLSVNVGSGTVEEASDWLEYMTATAPATRAVERAANGHKAPYRVKYLGLGNEMWGCGGSFTADEYVTKMKPFAHFVHNQNPAQAAPAIDFAAIAKDLMAGKPMDALPSNPNGMRRIAGGPNSADPSYTDVIMKAWKSRSPIYWDTRPFCRSRFDPGIYRFGSISLPHVDAIAARDRDGKVWLALTNLDPGNAADFPVSLGGVPAHSATGEVLTAERVDTINTLTSPDAVSPKPVTFAAAEGKLVIKLPAKSLTVVRLDP